jgi:hypothetical protein
MCMLYEFLNNTRLYGIHLCPEEILFSCINCTTIDTRRQFIRNGCAVWLGFCTVRYGTCRKHRSTSLRHRGTTSVTYETGMFFRKGVLRMRVVISPSRPHTLRAYSWRAHNKIIKQWIFTVVKNATSIPNLLHAQIFDTNANFWRHRQFVFDFSAHFEL